MSENNKALLSQKEIDTLVKFLVDQKQGIQSNVLTQESIDKLVLLLSNQDLDLLKFDIPSVNDEVSNETEEVLSNLVQYDNTLLYELSYTISDGHINLIAINNETNTVLHITPKSLELMKIVDDNSYWGCCIDPVLFDKIATIFHFKYSRTTLDSVTKLFAEKMYGSTNIILPSIYKASTLSVAQNILD